MAYDAPDYSVVLWDASGKPYWKLASGKKSYIPPIVAMQERDDPKLLAWAKSQGFSIGTNPDGTTAIKTNAPGGGLIHNRGTWNSQTGKYDQGINWGNIAALGIGAAIAAPFVVGAVAGGAAGGGAAGGVGVGETGATVGLASGAGLPGAVAAPTVASLGAGAGGAGIGTLSGTTPVLEGVAAGPGAISVPASQAAGVGIGETGATTGLASGAGLPGATAIPSVADLATVGSSVPGIANAAVVPAAAAGGVGTTLANLLPKAIPAAANIIGNQMQKGAIDDAVKAQVGSQEKALEAERLGGERAIGILAPWANVGGAAANRLGELLHLQAPSAVPGQVPVTPAQQSSANGFVPTAVANSPDPAVRNVPQGPGPYANWPIFQAPDGTKRRVSPDQAAAAQAAGATRIG